MKCVFLVDPRSPQGTSSHDIFFPPGFSLWLPGLPGARGLSGTRKVVNFFMALVLFLFLIPEVRSAAAAVHRIRGSQPLKNKGLKISL